MQLSTTRSVGDEREGPRAGTAQSTARHAPLTDADFLRRSVFWNGPGSLSDRRTPRSTLVAPKDERRTPRSTFVVPQGERRTPRATFVAAEDERRTPGSTFAPPRAFPCKACLSAGNGQGTIQQTPAAKRLRCSENKKIKPQQEGTSTSNTTPRPIFSKHEAVFSERKPIYAEREPISSEREPISSEQEPISSEREPISSEREPISSEREPISSEREPIHSEQEPIRLEREPIISEHGATA